MPKITVSVAYCTVSVVRKSHTKCSYIIAYYLTCHGRIYYANISYTIKQTKLIMNIYFNFISYFHFGHILMTYSTHFAIVLVIRKFVTHLDIIKYIHINRKL